METWKTGEMRGRMEKEGRGEDDTKGKRSQETMREK